MSNGMEHLLSAVDMVQLLLDNEYDHSSFTSKCSAQGIKEREDMRVYAEQLYRNTEMVLKSIKLHIGCAAEALIKYEDE